jgi:porin
VALPAGNASRLRGRRRSAMGFSFARSLRGATALSAAVLAGSLVLGIGTQAQAQGTSSDTPPGYFFTLGDPLKSTGQQLADKGIYFNGANVGVFYDNASGGLQTGAWWTNDASAGMDFDMTKLAGIPGAKAHILFDDRASAFPAKFTGALWGISPEYGPVETFQLSELSWEQSLFDDHLRLLFGRIGPLGDFSTFDVYCNFYSIGVCGNGPPGYYFNDSSVLNPMATWGFRASVKPTLSTYIRAGIYANEAGGDPFYSTTNHGFTDWGLHYANGVFVPFQIGYDSINQNYPTHLFIGGYYDSSPYIVPATASQFSYMDRGRTDFYFGIEQTVYKPDPKGSRQLLVFFEPQWVVEGQTPIPVSFVAGAVFEGPFASRPHDTFNVAFDWAKHNHRFANAAAFDSGIAASLIAQTENWVEVSYSLALAPGLSFQPFIQYFTNPDQAAAAVYNPKVKDSFVVGFATVVVLNGLLGLPGLGHSN